MEAYHESPLVVTPENSIIGNPARCSYARLLKEVRNGN
jgi:hypothetical protein